MFFLFRSLRWELVSGDVIEGHEMREVCGAKGGGELRAENHRRRQLDVKTGNTSQIVFGKWHFRNWFFRAI